eukprot:g3238.t1
MDVDTKKQGPFRSKTGPSSSSWGHSKPFKKQSGAPLDISKYITKRMLENPWRELEEQQEKLQNPSIDTNALILDSSSDSE